MPWLRYPERQSLGERNVPAMDTQVPRGSRPDGVSGDTALLVKSCRYLRLTYQIRLLTFMASERKMKLVLAVRKDCRLSRDLKKFLRANRRHVSVETR